MSPRWLHWPAVVVSGNDYYDSFVSGSDYIIIPDGSNPTNQYNFNPLLGDGSTNWSGVRLSTLAGSTVVTDSQSVSMDTYFQYCIQGGFDQLSNPYRYCASYHDGNVTGGNNATPDGPGWVIWETETTPGTAQFKRQTFAPIEVQSGVVIDSSGTTQTGSGYGPIWTVTLVPPESDSFVFFFNSYTAGEVQGWSTWDGSTVP